MIEVANISGAFNSLKIDLGIEAGTKLDYQKLVSAITLGSEIVSKTAYFETRNNVDEVKQQKFIDFFKITGYAVVTKEVKMIQQADGSTKGKANFDVEMTTDICRHVWRRDCNEVIIVSGDSDFAYLIDMIKELDIKVTVVSSKGTLSKELRDRADRLILLDELDLKNFTYSKPDALAV